MKSQTIANAFEKKVAEDKYGLAVFDSKRSLSREELSRLADTIAAKLPQNSRRIGIIMDHSVEMIASILAVLKRGAAYVPAEPAFPKERIRFMMRDAAVDAVITQTKYRHLVRDIPAVTVERGQEIEERAALSAVSRRGEDPAYILYTSGTTGKPKGIAVTNANVLHYIGAFRREFRPDPNDTMLQYSVCSFDIFVEEVFSALLSGMKLAIPSAADKQDIGSLMDFVRKNHITVISGFPYLLQEMNELPALPESLRLLISGGDVLRASYVDRLIHRVTVYNTYGPSETTVCAAYYNCSEGAPLEDGTYPVGKPVYGADIVIADLSGKEVPRGKTGELCILGDGVSLGYIGSRRKENEAFETLADGRRMYHSGDLGYLLPDGNIAFLHRKDTQIMIRGKRVEVSEVENVLLQSGMIHQACVCPKTDDQHLSYMVAYIVKKDAETALTQIKSYLADYLTDFMVPEFFVELSSLPLNPNGKVDKAALPKVERERMAA